MVDRAGDALVGPVAHRVGNDARAEAHRHHARCADQRSGQRRRLVSLGGRHRDAGRQAEQRGPVAIERASVCAGLLHMRQQVAERSHLLAVCRGRDDCVEVGKEP